MKTEHILYAVTTLLDQFASASERWEAAQALLDELPDFGDKVSERMHKFDPTLSGTSPIENEGIIHEIFTAYGLVHPDEV